MGTRRKDETYEEWRIRDRRERKERYAASPEVRAKVYADTKRRRLDPEVRRRTADAATARLNLPGRREQDRLQRKARIYGIPKEKLINLLDGVCGICGSNNNGRTLHIDHDHECCPGERSCGGCIRGALCYPCNYSYERYLDSPRVIAYLSGTEAGKTTLARQCGGEVL